MGLETKKEDIDGLMVSVTQFPGMEAIKLHSYLGRKIVPALAGIMGSVGSLKDLSMESDVDTEALSSAFATLFDQLTESELEKLLLRMLKTTTVDGAEVKKETIDIIFSGRTTAIYKILWFVIKVNYPDFFALGGSIGLLIRATGTSSKDQESDED